MCDKQLIKTEERNLYILFSDLKIFVLLYLGVHHFIRINMFKLRLRMDKMILKGHLILQHTQIDQCWTLYFVLNYELRKLHQTEHVYFRHFNMLSYNKRYVQCDSLAKIKSHKNCFFKTISDILVPNFGLFATYDRLSCTTWFSWLIMWIIP